MYMAALGSAMGQRNEAAVFIGEAQRRDERTFCQLLQRDSKRKTELRHEPRLIRQTAGIVAVFPKTRVVCCVRDAPWIMDSIERLVRGNVFELSGVFGFEPGNTVYTRINRMATPWPGWHVIGTGDYSGRSDILFQNSSGAVDIWEMRGTNVLASNSLGNPGPTRHLRAG
jgi:hypothetical protein